MSEPAWLPGTLFETLPSAAGEGRLLVQVMHEYVGQCQWSPEGAKLWQMMEYLIPRRVEFQRDELFTTPRRFPVFRRMLLAERTLAQRVADNVVRLGYWPELMPALEGMYEMRRKSSRSQGAGRLAGLLLWNNPYKRIAVEECATALIRDDLWRLNAAWKALFLNLPPWSQKPTPAKTIGRTGGRGP